MNRVLNTSTTEYRIFSQGSGKCLQSKGGQNGVGHSMPLCRDFNAMQRVDSRCPWDSISGGAPDQNDSNTSGMYCQTPIGGEWQAIKKLVSRKSKSAPDFITAQRNQNMWELNTSHVCACSCRKMYTAHRSYTMWECNTPHTCGSTCRMTTIS